MPVFTKAPCLPRSRIVLIFPTEVAGLKKLVTRLLHLLAQEAGAEQSQTIPEFCRSEKINRAFFYQLQKTGRAPRTMRHADGCIRISPEARKDWRHDRERETAQSA